MSRLARLKTCFARVAQSPREALSRGKHRHATDAHSGERRIRASTLKTVLECNSLIKLSTSHHGAIAAPHAARPRGARGAAALPLPLRRLLEI